MKSKFNDYLISYLTLFSGLSISVVAIYYSVMGLTAIYPASVIPIVIMGVFLELGKLSGTLWLKQNWKSAPLFLKSYIFPAIAMIMLITSVGVFGFLSKAHSDQNLVSGDVQSRIVIYDEKIKTAKENIESDRKQLKQMDEAVDQVMARSSDEKGAEKANAIRKNQSRDRVALAKDIEANQKIVVQLNDEAAPIRAEVRKVEAEVGPIKYIAALLYGDNPDSNLLERAVTWVTILIVIVLDPLAIVLLLASQYSFQRLRDEDDDTGKVVLSDDGTIIGVVPSIADLDSDVGEKPTAEELNEIDSDREELERSTDPEAPTADELSPLDQWNKMIEEATAAITPVTTSTGPYLWTRHTVKPYVEPVADNTETNIVSVPDYTIVGDADNEEPTGEKIAKEVVYVQNEEQNESGKWQSITEAKTISEEEYLNKAIENQKK